MTYHDVDVETAADVPSDMAMEGPNTGIVGIDLEHDVIESGEKLNIASLRILWVGDFAIPDAETLRKHEEVVTVHVHRMGGRKGIVDDQSNRLVGSKVVHIPFRIIREGRLSLLGVEQDRTVVVGVEGLLVHLEVEVASLVDDTRDREILGRLGVGIRRHGVERLGLAERILRTYQQRPDGGNFTRLTLAHGSVESFCAVVVGFAFLSA